MNGVDLKFEMKELELLGTLAADQLFRREFIDSRMPGCRVSPSELKLGKELVSRLRTITDRAKGISPRQAVVRA